MATMASVRPESGRIVYAGSDFSHPFQLRFSKEGVDHTVQNRPGSYLDLPGQGLAKRIWSESKPVCRNHLVRFPAGCNRFAAASFPLSDSVPFFTDVPDTNVQNQPGSDLVLADCVRFWPNGSGPEASQCARITRSASGQRFPADQDRIEIGSGMFTGKIVLLQQIITLSCHR